MHINLNDTPACGPLTAEELDRYRNLHRVTLPGVDIDAAHRRRAPGRQTLAHCAGPCQQGRRLCPCPEACEAATDDTDALGAAKGVIVGLICGLAIWAAGAAAWLALRT